MSDLNVRGKGLAVQFIGLMVLLGGTRGTFVPARYPFLYYTVLFAAVVVFAICLFWGGSLYKNGKEEAQKQAQSCPRDLKDLANK